MKTIAYHTIDKTSWGPGAWQHEPDKKQWPDPATGLPCLALRHAHLGHWCGYVGVPPSHPCHGRNYGEVDVEVHGGLTFADSCNGGDASTGVCHLPAPGEPDHVWWLGFDCAHVLDLPPALAARELALGFPLMEQATYRDLAYVEAQCAQLASQLAKLPHG